jgi:hypothetical protein
MGGNALTCKGVETIRLDAEKFQSLSEKLITQLRAVFPNRKIEVCQAYREKPSFGDMDILIETFSGENIRFKEQVIESFEPVAIVKNGNVISFGYKLEDGDVFQIDLILCPSNHFQASYYYFAWNDLSNFFGVVSRCMGFKYGHTGLSIQMKHDTYQFADIHITGDVRKALTFLGYDADRYFEGFNNLEDIFRFASSSEFFNKELFLFGNRNHDSRVRDKKRANYNAFLVWLEDNDNIQAYPYAEMKEHGYIVKDIFLQRLYNFFPEMKDKVANELIKFDEWKTYKERFNGRIVTEITGLEKLELGEFMKFIKGDSIKHVVMNSNQDELKHYIETKLIEFKKEPV